MNNDEDQVSLTNKNKQRHNVKLSGTGGKWEQQQQNSG
jgi:hypothetical protein